MNTEIKIIKGDITKQNADTIVNTANGFQKIKRHGLRCKLYRILLQNNKLKEILFVCFDDGNFNLYKKLYQPKT